MAIKYDPAGETQSTVEDKVRALPENQGKNEDEMWTEIDKAVEQARKDGKLRDIEERRDQHGAA